MTNEEINNKMKELSKRYENYDSNSNAHHERENERIEREIAPPPPFDKSMFPPQLGNRIEDVTKLIGTSFTAGVPITITMLGTLIGKKVGLKMTRNSGWTEYPNVWGMLVGGASKGKTPVAKQLRGALYKAEADIFADYQKEMDNFIAESNIHGAKKQKFEIAQKLYAKDAITEEKLEKASKDLPPPPKPPTLERITVDDATPEALADLMNSRPAGTLLIQDELSAMFDKLGASGREGERQFYLKAWSNETVIIDRIGRGHSLIKDATLGIYGNIQESVLRGAIDEAVHATKADGFLPRFQCVGILSEDKEMHEDRKPDYEAKTAYDKIVKDFVTYTHETLKGTQSDRYNDDRAYYSLADDALSLFNSWTRRNSERIKDCDGAAIEAHLAKLPKLVAAICIIFHIIDIHDKEISDNDAHFIPRSTMQMALKLTDMFTEHALYLYYTSKREEETQELLEDKLLTFIAYNQHLFPISAKELGRKIWINKKTPSASDIKNVIENSPKLKTQIYIKKRILHIK